MPASVGAGWVAAVALLLVYGVCLVNAGIAIDFTLNLAGPRPESLQHRYGDLRVRLDDVIRVAYISDSPAYFLGARYALAPTILDIRFVDRRREDSSISGYRLDALVDDALADAPLLVLCEFDSSEGFGAFVDGLSAAAAKRGLRVEATYGTGRLSLLSMGG